MLSDSVFSFAIEILNCFVVEHILSIFKADSIADSDASAASNGGK